MERSFAAVSISDSVGLKARGLAIKILSIRPWSWSIFAMSLAAFSNLAKGTECGVGRNNSRFFRGIKVGTKLA